MLCIYNIKISRLQIIQHKYYFYIIKIEQVNANYELELINLNQC